MQVRKEVDHVRSDLWRRGDRCLRRLLPRPARQVEVIVVEGHTGAQHLRTVLRETCSSRVPSLTARFERGAVIG
jgi:hypothetical protein